MRKDFSVGLLAIICLISQSAVFGQPLAFPGAEGFGKHTTGGRGGTVVEVTNLLDMDMFGNPEPGSLRAALNTEGADPITIVFRVSGIIELKAELESGRSNMTIAGQTAPGAGICIKGATVKLSGSNLIIRYIRFRPGDELQQQTSALNIENTKNIIIDHCSMSWAVEENMGFYDNKYTTVQWCILSEGLRNSYHSKGARGYGSQWGGQYASYHHNILAHNYSRSPRVNGSRAHDTVALVDYRNNVIFNWGRAGAIYGGEEEILGGTCQINFVNNYYKPGPGTDAKKIFAEPSYVTDGNEPAGYAEWYFSGNYMEGVTGGMNDDNWLGVDAGRVGSADNIRADAEFEVEEVETQTAQEALELVLEQAGAILPTRDAVDARIVAEIKGEIEVTGDGIIDSQTEVGGWPEYKSLEAPADSDVDGMPDAWETENGFDPNNAADGSATAENGYTNLENYLNSITETIILSVPAQAPEDFQVYPNPARDKVFFSSRKKLLKAELIDLKGSLISSKNNLEAGINHFFEVDQLDSGIYVLKFIFPDGRTVESKVIKN